MERDDSTVGTPPLWDSSLTPHTGDSYHEDVPDSFCPDNELPDGFMDRIRLLAPNYLAALRRQFDDPSDVPEPGALPGFGPGEDAEGDVLELGLDALEPDTLTGFESIEDAEGDVLELDPDALEPEPDPEVDFWGADGPLEAPSNTPDFDGLATGFFDAESNDDFDFRPRGWGLPVGLSATALAVLALGASYFGINHSDSFNPASPLTVTDDRGNSMAKPLLAATPTPETFQLPSNHLGIATLIYQEGVQAVPEGIMAPFENEAHFLLSLGRAVKALNLDAEKINQLLDELGIKNTQLVEATRDQQVTGLRGATIVLGQFDYSGAFTPTEADAESINTSPLQNRILLAEIFIHASQLQGETLTDFWETVRASLRLEPDTRVWSNYGDQIQGDWNERKARFLTPDES